MIHSRLHFFLAKMAGIEASTSQLLRWIEKRRTKSGLAPAAGQSTTLARYYSPSWL